jgi:hypothetical protein
MKEIAVLMGKGFNAVAGRGSELKALGLVRKTGEVREGSAVLEIVKESEIPSIHKKAERSNWWMGRERGDYD